MLTLSVNPGYRKHETMEYIRVRSCYTITVGEELMYSRRFLEYCEMIYVMVGKVYIAVSGREYVVGAGEILVIPCYQTVDGVRRSNVKTTFFSCEFSCSDGMIDEIAERVVAIRESEYFISTQFMRMNSLLPVSDNEDSNECDALCLAILCAVRSNIVSSDRNSPSVLNSVMTYINENIDKILTVEEVAAHFGYNKDYLLRLFRERYGITIKKYVNEKKLTMVKRLLITTDMSVAKIGASIGFGETELFEKFFKYHEKVSPLRYRKMNR